MGTRAYIGMVCDDGTIKAAYCGHDGYLSGVGATLLDRYQAPEKVEKLIDLAGFSELCPTVEETAKDKYKEKYEDFNTPETFANEEAYRNSDESYAYLLKGGLWHYSKSGESFQQLTRQAIKDAED